MLKWQTKTNCEFEIESEQIHNKEKNEKNKDKLKNSKSIKNTDMPFFVNYNKSKSERENQINTFPKKIYKTNEKISNYNYNYEIENEQEVVDVRWKGNNNLCCKGKIYVSPNYYYGLITSFYITLYSVFVIIFVLKVSWLNKSFIQFLIFF